MQAGDVCQQHRKHRINQPIFFPAMEVVFSCWGLDSEAGPCLGQLFGRKGYVGEADCSLFPMPGLSASVMELVGGA